MTISAISASPYLPSAAASGGNADKTIQQLEKQKDELTEEIEDAQAGGKKSEDTQAEIQALQSKLAVIEMKITIEKAKQEKQSGRQVHPPADNSAQK